MAINKKFRRRVSYLPTFFSISLVLFLAGLFGLFLLNANSLKEKARESILMNVYFKDDATQKDILSVQKELKTLPNVKEVEYISKEEALKKWQEEMGENAEELLGFNPLPNSIDVAFRSDFVEEDSLKILKASLEAKPLVREVTYNELVVHNVDRNVRIAGIILLSLAALMAAVSIALINNTIRLTLYSKRFIIKSMQLVGATQNFIRKPFILKGFLIGLLSSIFACILLLACLYILIKNYPDLALLQNNLHTGILLLGIIVLGIIISGLSSYGAINKYLKMKLDDLF